MNSLDW